VGAEDDFNKIWPAVAALTVSPRHRCWALYQAAVKCGAAGAVAEIGVYRGGTLMLLAAALPCRQVFGFDTFMGMPDNTPDVDQHKAGDFGWTNVYAVKRSLVEYSNVRLRPGLFPVSAQGIDGPFAFVHFDGDLYKTCKDTIEFFWPRLTPGGVMVFDDYRWPQCPGVEKAIIEAGLKVSLLPDGEYQAVAVKE
jgi:O-methyltransferase